MTDTRTLTVPRNTLASALLRALSVNPKDGLVTLDVGETMARVRATGERASIAIDIPTAPTLPFRSSVLGSALLERVEAMPAGPVSFSVDGTGATLSSGRRLFRLRPHPGVDFTEEWPETWADVTPASTGLAAALRAVVHASPLRNETSLPPCVVLESVAGALVVYAVDGSRVSLARVEGLAWPRTVLVHGQDVKALSAELERATEASVSLGPFALWIQTQDAVASFTTVVGSVPSSTVILGLLGATVTRTVANTAELMDCLHATSLASGEHRGVTLTMESELGVVTLASVDGPKAIGAAVDDCTCEIKGVRAAVRANYRFLTDAIKALGGAQVEICLGDMTAERLAPIALRNMDDMLRVEMVMPQRGAA